MNIDALGSVLTASLVALVCSAPILGLLWWKRWLAVAAAVGEAACLVLFTWNPDLVGGTPLGWILVVSFGLFFAGAGALAALTRLFVRARAVDRSHWTAFARGGAVMFAVMAAAYLASRYAIGGLTPGARSMAFDPAVWRAGGCEEGSFVSDRARMLHDLVHRALPGRTRTELVELLGSDHSIGPPSSHGEGGEELWVPISPTVDEFLSSAYLVIAFDESGVFRDAWLGLD